jgi:site-specific DNA-cytosine methylase
MGFEFQGTLGSVARQIGNAVPVALAKNFATALRCHVEDGRSPARAAL